MAFVCECKKCWIYPRTHIYIRSIYRHFHTIINVSFCFELAAFHLSSCNCHFLLTSLNSSLSSIWSMSILAKTQRAKHRHMYIFISILYECHIVSGMITHDFTQIELQLSFRLSGRYGLTHVEILKSHLCATKHMLIFMKFTYLPND